MTEKKTIIQREGCGDEAAFIEDELVYIPTGSVVRCVFGDCVVTHCETVAETKERGTQSVTVINWVREIGESR